MTLVMYDLVVNGLTDMKDVWPLKVFKSEAKAYAYLNDIIKKDTPEVHYSPLVPESIFKEAIGQWKKTRDVKVAKGTYLAEYHSGGNKIEVQYFTLGVEEG